MMFSTFYNRSDSLSERHGTTLFARNREHASELVKLRGMGEILYGSDHHIYGRPKLSSELLRGGRFAEAAHAGCWLGMIAVSAGVRTGFELLCDDGVIHVLSHFAESCGINLNHRDALLHNPQFPKLLRDTMKLEQEVPGMFPVDKSDFVNGVFPEWHPEYQRQQVENYKSRDALKSYFVADDLKAMQTIPKAMMAVKGSFKLSKEEIENFLKSMNAGSIQKVLAPIFEQMDSRGRYIEKLAPNDFTKLGYKTKGHTSEAVNFMAPFIGIDKAKGKDETVVRSMTITNRIVAQIEDADLTLQNALKTGLASKLRDYQMAAMLAPKLREYQESALATLISKTFSMEKTIADVSAFPIATVTAPERKQSNYRYNSKKREFAQTVWAQTV